ncbi:MAG TPA: alpha-L-fucosidase [Candidatus Aminicenantes bacterium]|nr:alpha-L-fucosidase [Candidatus Aminicenantes bacterium]HDT12966.1 alpha-L-fucosidase [Candidatus Aminicenantes bacterium]
MTMPMIPRVRVPVRVAVLTALVFVAVAASVGCPARPPERADAETPAVPLVPEDAVRLSNDPAKTEIFRDAGLGLFIHWGPNSQVGTEISWPLYNASEAFIESYYALAETFEPTAFDPAGWARLAKLAGIEYVVFTAKHHDGFCMFDTALSDLKITRTPFGKDIAAMVAEAFRKEGLLVGFYYSPGDFRYQWETGRRTGHITTPDFDSPAPFGPNRLGFADYERGQIEELLTRYGDIFMLWFDGACEPLKMHAWRVRQDVFIGRGEIPTPEQEIPGQAADHAWESCLTTSYQWSYLPRAVVRPTAAIIENLIHIRARGGNMLLNVGPRPDGTIAPADEELLRDLGLWMMLYGESVRGVRPWTITNEGEVWFTRKNGEGTVYALAGLEGNARTLLLRSVAATPETKVTLLGQEGELPWERTPAGLKIEVTRKQTVRLVKAPPLPGAETESSDKQRLVWGPDWPVAVKITGAAPTAGAAEGGSK